MAELPTGTVTFLFTDIEGSSKLWEERPAAMQDALERHDAILRDATEAHRGYVFSTGGDAFCCAFDDARDAVAAVFVAQQALQRQARDDDIGLRVRMALHAGPAQERDGDYFGAALNRAARLLSCAHGGQTLLSGVTYELVRDGAPEGVSFQELGEHSLRDLSHPEHIFQLCHPDLPGDFAPLRSLQAFAHNLPLQLTSFVGREQEMDDVKELLRETRLLTLTGVGGSGKSRLALQVAAEVLDDYTDGVWLTELAPLSDPELLPQTVASALGVREQPERSIVATLIEHLRPKDCLLILDNCEHLLEACARLADELLRSCPKVTVMASSREGLGIRGETTHHVLSLLVPPEADEPAAESLTPYESVRLFLDRAESQQPSFEITDANAGPVAQICRRLDGIPLAIELAAARIGTMSVDQTAERLDDRFRLLTGGSRTALPRQQTLQATMDWSHDLLTEQEQTLLRRLSVFAGGWTLGAPEAVCSGDGIEQAAVLDLLTSLVDKSMVAYEEQGASARYRLLETVRQYARDRLVESGEGATLRERHRDFFLVLSTEPSIRSHESSETQRLDSMELEHDNLRAALEWCQETASGAGPGLEMAAALARFWRARGHLTEGRQRLAAALSQADDTPTPARGRALGGAGFLANSHGDFRAADGLFRRSVDVHRELGDERGLALSLGGRGHAARSQGEYAAARALYEEELAIQRRLSDKAGIAGSLSDLGLVAWQQGDYSAARPLLEESLAIRRELRDASVAQSISRLGLVASSQGDHSAAVALLEESLAMHRDSGEEAIVASGLSNLGLACWRQGDHSRARALLTESLTLWRRHEANYLGGLCLERLAAVWAADGDMARATRLLGAAAAGRQASGGALSPALREEYEHNLAQVRDALDGDAFETAWAEGQAMTMDDAVEYALRENEEPTTEGPAQE